MGAEIIPFDFEEQAVRVVVRDGAPWWVAVDVCRVLEISNPRDALLRLDDDERDGVGITDAIGRAQTANVINESGFYKLVLTSRKPAAKRFTKWVTAEVLPALRRFGRYEMPGASAAQEPFGITISADRYVRVLEFERDEAQAQVAALRRQLEQDRAVDHCLRAMLRAGTLRPRAISDLEEKAIATLFNHGHSAEDISRITGRSISAIRARGPMPDAKGGV